ncbi:hypothetical protein M434DRAFT_199475 [Hypoxylon sp. CO27-5]|nr:hypothetical protein M434DRAFT_199475 [Hypoxylon sp. CO27-5]
MSRVSRSTRQSQQRTAHNPMERQLERSPSPIPQRVGNSVRIDSQTRRFRSIHEDATASESSTMAERRPLLDSHNSEECTATGSSMASEHRVPNPEKLQDRPSTTRRVYSSAFAHRRRPISNQYSTPERTLTSLLRNWVQHRRDRGNNTSSHASSEGQRLLSTSSDGKNEQPDHPDSIVSTTALEEASREGTERFEPGSPSSVITVIRVSAPAELNSSHESNESERVNIPVAVSRSLSLSLDRNVLAWRSRSDPGPLSPIQASAVGTAPTSSGIRPREAVSNGANGNPGPSATSSDIGSQSLDNISLPVSRSIGNNNDGTDGTSSTSASSSLVLHNPYTPPGTPEHNGATVGIDGTSSLPEAPSSIAASKPVETANNRPVSSHSTESSTPGASHRMRMTNREDMSLLAAASSPPRYTFFAPFDDQRAEPPSPRQDANRSPPLHSASQRRSSRPPTGRRERVQDHAISRASPTRSNRSLRSRSPDQARRLGSFRTHPYVLGGRDPGPSTASTSVETRGRNQQQREEGRDRQEVGLGISLLDTAEQQQDQRENNLQNLIDEQYQGGVAEQEQDDDQRTIVDLEQQTVLARPLSIKERLKKTWRCVTCFPMSTSKKMLCLVFLGLSIVIIIGGPPFWFFFR